MAKGTPLNREHGRRRPAQVRLAPISKKPSVVQGLRRWPDRFLAKALSTWRTAFVHVMAE